MKTTIEGIVYSVTDNVKMTARVGTGTEDDSNAINGQIKNSIFFQEFVEIDGKKYEVTEIGTRAFRACQTLTNVVFHSKFRVFEHQSFDQCNNLREATFTDGSKLEKMSYGVFFNTALTSIILPKTLKNVDTYIFSSCTKLALVAYCGKREITSTLFDYPDTKTPTPSLRIIVSPFYKSQTLGGRIVDSKELSGCYFRECSAQIFRQNSKFKSCFLVFIFLS